MLGESHDPAALDPYDALLLVSFGGPEQEEDVVPFLENVTRGRGIPKERLVEVGQHYFHFGGRSPINDQNRELLAALREDLASAGLNIGVYWGNRNWDPYLNDTITQMRADGVRRAACFITSAYSSYSGCRQYRENLASALGDSEDLQLDRLRAYFNHPAFIDCFVDATLAALGEVSGDNVELAFVTHSVPDTMNDLAGPDGGAYVSQHLSVVAEVVARIAQQTGRTYPAQLVFCSRSGDPRMPWLEPDINDHLEQVAASGADGVVMVPIGFVSDHMEVVWDLDTEAMATAERLRLPAARAATPGIDPRFVAMVRDLLLERAAAERGQQPERQACGSLPAAQDRCPTHCCANARAVQPTIGNAEETVR